MTEQAGEIRPVSIRRFLSETAIYGLLDIADKAIGLLLLPLTTYILVPADYGILSLFGTSLQFLSLIIGLGMQSTFIRFYAEKHEKSHQLAVLNTVFAIAACSAFLWLAILFSLSKVLSQALFDQDSISLVILLGVNATLDVHNTLGMCRLRMDGQLVPFFWISIASTLCKRGIGVLLMLLGYGAFGWIIGELIGLTLTAVLIWLNALTGLSFRVDRTLVVTLLLFGVNFVPISASHWLMLSSDKYMIKELMDDGSGEVGATYVGYYGVGERISSILSLVVMAFTMGWQRFAYHNIHLPDGPRLIAKSGTLYVSMIGYVAMALALLGDDLIKWGGIDPKFYPGMQVIPILTFASFWWGLGAITALGMMKSNRSGHLAIQNGIAAGVNIALIYVLIRNTNLGIEGAALATCICQCLKTLLALFVSQRLMPIPLEYRRIGVSFGVFTAVFLAGYYGFPTTHLEKFDSLRSTLIQTGFVLLTPAALWICGFFDEVEKQSLKQLLRGNFSAFLNR